MVDLPPALEEITGRDGWQDDPQAWQEFLRRWARSPQPHVPEARIACGR